MKSRDYVKAVSNLFTPKITELGRALDKNFTTISLQSQQVGPFVYSRMLGSKVTILALAIWSASGSVVVYNDDFWPPLQVFFFFIFFFFFLLHVMHDCILFFCIFLLIEVLDFSHRNNGGAFTKKKIMSIFGRLIT